MTRTSIPGQWSVIILILIFSFCNPQLLMAGGTSILTERQIAEPTATTVAPLPTICRGTTSLTFSATVSPDPGAGTIQFQLDGANVGTPALLIGGSASLVYDPASLPSGNHTVTAVFNGNVLFSGSTSPPVTLSINQINPGLIAKGATNQGMSCAPLNPNITLVPNGTTSTPATGTGSITYAWQQSTDGGTNWTAAIIVSPETSNTGVQFNPGPMNTTTRLRRVAVSTLNSVACTAISNELEYIVYPLPVVAPISPPTSEAINVCEGATIQLTNATSGGTWSSNNLASVTVNSTGLVTGISATAANSQNISYTVTSTNGCVRTVNRTIKVLAAPVVSSSTAVCINETYNLVPNTGGSWISNDPGIATVTGTGLVTGVSAGAVSFRFTSSTAPGCSKTTPLVSVNPKPTAEITSTDREMCLGESANITGNVTATGNWTITLNDGSTAMGTGNASFNINVNPGASTTYVIASLTAESCNGIAAGLTGSTMVNVKNNPVAPDILVVDNCNGTSTLTASTYTGSLAWSTGESDELITVTTAGSYTLTQTVDGCTSMAASATASPKTTPVLPEVSSPIEYCRDSLATQLAATGTNLLWYENPAGGSGNSTAPTPQTSAAGSKAYYVSQTIEGCESERASITVTVKDNCSAMPVTLVAFSLKNNENAVAVTWITASEVNSSTFEIQRSLHPSKEFTKIAVIASHDSHNGARYTYLDSSAKSAMSYYYRLKMIDFDGTFTYSRIQNIKPALQYETEVYPNPVSQQLTVRTSNWQNVTGIRIRNRNGEILYTFSGKSLFQKFDVAKLPAALYSIEIMRNTGKPEFKQFVVIH